MRSSFFRGLESPTGSKSPIYLNTKAASLAGSQQMSLKEPSFYPNFMMYYYFCRWRPLRSESALAAGNKGSFDSSICSDQLFFIVKVVCQH